MTVVFPTKKGNFPRLHTKMLKVSSNKGTAIGDLKSNG
jgi:hypothetical protein